MRHTPCPKGTYGLNCAFAARKCARTMPNATAFLGNALLLPVGMDPSEIICTLKLLSSSEVVKIHVRLAHTANFAHTLVAVRMMEPAIALQETVAAPQGGWEDFVNNNVQMTTGSLNAGINVHVRTTGFAIE
ncbi:unnamed protein product [Darwinula stevensoni]|uniref:Uncharacterized protein n=1 Tax=Darwinula stevensoni TaxID=69355 RepID=A0A7R9AAX4_9CRUS|nr:unnamed protein product [Darwinula stevensoni]CAG0898559.1 unnamed protein product [Darwinula stevensoni]